MVAGRADYDRESQQFGCGYFVRGTMGIFTIGGADGIRTHDLLDAIEARSQLRHGPTEPILMLAQARKRDHV